MSLTLTLKDNGGNPLSGEGTSITLNNTRETNFTKFDLYGDTQQQTYSGKNLTTFPYTDSTTTSNGITFTNNGDGSITMNGTNTGTADSKFYMLNSGSLTLPAGTYYVIPMDGITASQVHFSLYDGSSWKTLQYSNNWSFTLTTQTTFTQFYIEVYKSYRSQINNLKVWPMLTTTANPTVSDYEPYVGGTASPNPDYPQEVQVVTGEQTITVSNGQGESQEYKVNLGKNLFDINQYTNAVTRGSTLVSLTKTSDTTLRTTNLYASTNNYCAIPIPDASRLLGNTITMSCNVTLTNVAATKAAIFWKTTSNTVGAQIGDTLSITTDGAKTLTFSVPDTFPSGTNGIFCAIYGSDSAQPADSYVDWENIQIEKGSATTYAPYFTPIELCKIGTYQDYIYKSGEDWYVHKETWNYTFDGSSDEQWIRSGQSTSTNFVAGMVNLQDFAMIGGDADSGYCNYFDFATYLADNKVILSGYQSGGYRFLLYRFPSGSTVTDLTSFTTWLGNNHLKMVLVLSTAEDYKITYEPLVAQLEALYNTAHSYNGTTIIASSSQYLPAIMDVTVGGSTNEVTYTETELSNPLTITDIEGKSQNTTLNGNIYVDYVYNKKSFSVSIFNLKSADYATIRGFYDRQFTLNEFPLLSIPELNISEMPVFFEIGSREINSQCIVTDKLTLKFRETAQQ